MALALLKMSKSESSVSIAYLGPEGTYTHAALLKYFGESQECKPKAEIHDVFSSVESGECTFGLVPVENSTEGSVNLTLECINSSSLLVCGEVLLRIHHCLMSSVKTLPGSINKIVSHQQSLGQCRHWLDKNFPAVPTIAVNSNAEAAKISEKEAGVASIASRAAAELYGLEVLFENIEDELDNTTRFWIIEKPGKGSFITGKDKTSIIISANNEPGTLFKALEPFHRFDVSLSKVESRPSRKGAWSYSFYVDFEGHISEGKVIKALAELEQHSLDVKILGSYPAANQLDLN